MSNINVPIFSKEQIKVEFQIQLKTHTAKIVKQIQKANDDLRHMADCCMLKLKVIIMLLHAHLHAPPFHYTGGTIKVKGRYHPGSIF